MMVADPSGYGTRECLHARRMRYVCGLIPGCPGTSHGYERGHVVTGDLLRCPLRVINACIQARLAPHKLPSLSLSYEKLYPCQKDNLNTHCALESSAARTLSKFSPLISAIDFTTSAT